MLGICQKEKEPPTWTGEGPGGLRGPQSHSKDGHSDPGQSMNQSGLRRRIWKASCRPLPLPEKLLGARGQLAWRGWPFLVVSKWPRNSNSILGQWFLSHVSEGPWLSLAKTRCLLTAQNKSWLPCPNLQGIIKLAVWSCSTLSFPPITFH